MANLFSSASRLFLPAIGLCLAGALAPAQNAGRTRFNYADLLRLRSVEDVAITPNGQQIAYTVTSEDPRTDRGTQSVWVLRVAEQQAVPIKLSHPGSPTWSPDGRQLAVTSQSADGRNTISLLRADNLETVRSFTVSASPSGLVWSPDSKALAFVLSVPDAVAPSVLQQAVDAAEVELRKPAGAKWAAPVQLTQEARYRQDGGTWLTPAHRHTFLLSIADGTPHQVGTGPFYDGDPAWTPDSTALLFSSDRRAQAAYATEEPAIFKVALSTTKVVQLTHSHTLCHNPVASPDGQWIAYTASEARPVNYTRSDLYLMRADGTGARRLGAELDRDVSAPRWEPNSQGIYAQYDIGGISRVGFFGLDGSLKELASGIDGGWSVSRKGELAYAGGSPTSPSELKLQRAGAAPVPLTSLNSFLQQRQLGHLVQLKTRSSADGVPVEGWALLPPGASGHDRLPMILAIHGGPFGDDGPSWSRTFQLYAAAGYAVVYANYRGSTSYGSRFSEPANHEFPGLAYDDLMSIVDEAVRSGLADSDRLFLTGGSAGGELTAWITGRTKRFRAAAAQKPVIDDTTEALTTDQYLGAIAFSEKAPWADQKTLWAQSPISLAGSMTTPMLLITGEDDYRTPLEQTLALYGALKLQNVPAALMRVPAAGHESLASRPSQFAAEIAATLAWFREYDSPATH